ncbi:MAG: EamA family transporter [Planctomycetes bacterium]|nr:EamA family transporter [Planctomycetota bacterium]
MAIPTNWVFWASLSAGFAALTAIFAKVGVQDLHPDLATLIRTGLVLLVLGPLVILTGQWRNPALISGKTWVFLVLSALATGASWVCYFRAIKLGDVSRVAPLDKASVVLVALFAVGFLGERLTVREWLGLALVVAGIVLIAARK